MSQKYSKFPSLNPKKSYFKTVQHETVDLDLDDMNEENEHPIEKMVQSMYFSGIVNPECTKIDKIPVKRVKQMRFSLLVKCKDQIPTSPTKGGTDRKIKHS